MGVPNVKKEFTHYPKCLKCHKVAKLEFINNSIDHINVYCEDDHTGTIMSTYGKSYPISNKK